MYAKIFNSLYSGTLRGRAHEILVFTNLLAFCDQDGVVDRHPRTIAEDIGLTVEETWEALRNLNEPDPESRSPEEGGRRIVLLEDHRNWGWIIVNHAKYKAIRNAEDRREKGREYTRKSRAKAAAVSSGKQSKPIQIQMQTTDVDSGEELRSCAESAEPTSTPQADDPIVMTFPVDGNARQREWHLRASKRDEWIKAFPALEVHKELLKARQWLLDSPTKRKTANGMPRFLGGWLGRAQNKPAGGGGSSYGRPTVRVSTGDEF